MIMVPLKNYHFDLQAIAARITDHTKIIYLSNPNNPTGTIFTRPEFDVFMKKVPANVLIILDEADFEYARSNPSSPDSMHYRYDNVIPLRTFSKVYGRAGIRIGYGFAHDLLIRNLLKVKLPFEPSTLAQAAGIGPLQDPGFLHHSLAVNAAGKHQLSTGLTFIPREANFFCVPLANENEAQKIYEDLPHKGIIIRTHKAFGLPRVSTLPSARKSKTHACSLPSVDRPPLCSLQQLRPDDEFRIFTETSLRPSSTRLLHNRHTAIPWVSGSPKNSLFSLPTLRAVRASMTKRETHSHAK